MKKIAVFAAALILSGCSAVKSAEKQKPVAEYFSVRAEVTDGDFSCEADMKRTSRGWEAVIDSPDTVKGTVFMIDGEQVHISSGELGYSVPREDFPDSSPIRLTAAALDKCVAKHTEGELCGQHYAVNVSDGVPKQLVIGSTVKVKFSKFKENKAEE